jgi:hypothetical protein
MILSREEILRRMDQYPITDKRNLVITPLPYKNLHEIFKGESVDLRLG